MPQRPQLFEGFGLFEQRRFQRARDARSHALSPRRDARWIDDIDMPDKISLADETFVASGLLSRHSRVTDSYLLALAHANGGRLATMDQKLATEAVPNGKASRKLVSKLVHQLHRDRRRSATPG